MHKTRIQLAWKSTAVERGHQSGVSLHSHTLCSRESLGFIYRLAARVGFIDSAIRRGQRRHGEGFNLTRGWWTPPLTPRAAWDLERNQIESAFGLPALVSLTDHDNIDAALSLHQDDIQTGIPVSVEWTVPVAGTFVHLGVHNLPPRKAVDALTAMQEYTSAAHGAELGDLLATLDSDPQTLIVLNHPLWDEEEVGMDRHRAAVEGLLRRHGQRIHALELNGLRPWRENMLPIALAQAWGKPVVSGGDRHGLEPNAMLNLTSAADFAGFVTEVRSGHSDVLITRQYRRSLFWRMFDAVLDAVGDHEMHGLGWKEWNQRVFYQCDDGTVRSLRQIWGNGGPRLVRGFTELARALHHSWLQHTLRLAMAGQREEVTL